MVGLEEATTFLNAVRNITGSVATVDDCDITHLICIVCIKVSV